MNFLVWVIMILGVGAACIDIAQNRKKARETDNRNIRGEYRQEDGSMLYRCENCQTIFYSPLMVCPRCGVHFNCSSELIDAVHSVTLIEHPHYDEDSDYECSRCGKRFDEDLNRCPFCGAWFTDSKKDWKEYRDEEDEEDDDDWFDENG